MEVLGVDEYMSANWELRLLRVAVICHLLSMTPGFGDVLLRARRRTSAGTTAFVLETMPLRGVV